MDNITLIIKNCNNIDYASVDIQSEKLNIKYGINGTGKSTIVSAIDLSINEGGDLNELIPFKYRTDKNNPENIPNVEGLENIDSVAVFNEKYVNNIVFKKEELIENSFGIFIKTPEYEQKMNEIEQLISGIKETFKDDEKIEKVIQDLSALSASFGNSSTGMHASGKLAKAISKGNPIENIKKNLIPYQTFLTLPDNQNVKWLGWHNKGSEFLEASHDCPYCTSPAEEKKEIIRTVKKEYNSTNIGHLNDIIKIMESLGEYFSLETHQRLKEIISNKGNISDEQKNFLTQIRPDIDTLRKKLSDLKEISFFSFKGAEKVKDKVIDFQINLSFLLHLQSEPLKEITDRINKSLQEIGDKVGLLQGQISQQKVAIEKNIKKHTVEINEFLTYAGYKYLVEIPEDNNIYRLRLRHCEHASHIENSSKHLSYGERNAFALVLFMYECLSKKLDLIILDDPISSFDKNKKYAIAEKLFLGEESFRNKTVLMVTHDLEPIIDMVRVHGEKYKQFQTSSFIENKNGSINETVINHSDIISFGNVCKTNIACAHEDIIRSIYLRRYYEILDNKGVEYHVLASLFKKRGTPTFDKNGDNEIPQIERDSAITSIRKWIESFDYNSIIKQLHDEKAMYTIYQNATSNYEKLQVHRIIVQGDSQDDLHENSVIRKFINGTFHIENEYVMQLDPSKYSPVPEYIIEECNKMLEHRFRLTNAE